MVILVAYQLSIEIPVIFWVWDGENRNEIPGLTMGSGLPGTPLKGIGEKDDRNRI